MRVNERMKKWISMALCLCMLVQNAPVVALAADADCTHHAEHTAECGYVAAVEGVPCAHEHSESCYAIQECLHTCGDECADGCGHECSVMECHRLLCAHAEGGHDDSCGYAEAVAAHECHYECAECAQAAAAAETEVAPETTAAATEAAPETTEAAEETTVAATEPVVETTEAATEPVVETTAAATEPEEEVTEAVTEAVTNPAMQDGAADKDTGTDTAVVYADCTCTVKCGETAYTECVVCAADPTACAAEESPVVSVTIGGNTNYHLTLADAVAAVASCTADDNAVVKMEQDVDLGSECLQIFSGVFTIDLNGKTLSSTHETYGTLYLDDGSVTIMDSSVDQTGKITGSYAGVEPRGDAVTIDGGTISGEQYGVYAFDGIVTINGGNINGNIGLYYLSQDGTVYINGGTISGTNTGVGFAGYIAATITGGSISGYYEDIYTSEENVELTLAEGKTEGATFPGGLTVGGTTLDVVLGEGAAYWQGDKMLTNVTGTSIDGDVTVKAVCDHANAAYPEITDTQHKIVCSCGYEVTGEHTTVKDENKVNCQHGDICDLCGEPYGEPTAHTFGEDYKCTLCGADCPHGSYTGGYCADCGKVATYTVSLYADGTGYTYGAQILSVNGAAVTPGETVTVEHGKDLTVVLRNGLSTLVEKVQVWKVRIVHDYTNVDYPIADSDADGETTESYDWYDISTGTLTIPGEYITGDVWIDAEAYVRNFVDLNGAALVIPEEMLGQMTEEEVIAMLKEQFGYDPESNSLTVDEPYDAENKGEATGAFGPTVQGLFGIEGYVFTGFTDSEGNTYPADYEVYVFVKDVVLTAQWECVHAAFSCEDNGDGTHSDICSVCGAVLETADHAYENGYCADCGKAATYNVWWQNNMGLLTGTVESFTYGQDLRAEVTIPENAHLRINGVYADDGSEVPYTYENGVLTIAAADLPAGDIWIDDYHYVNVKFDANGGTITQEGEFPQEFIVDFAQDGSYLILTFDIGIEKVAHGFSSNFSANREGWTWTQKWMDAAGNVYDGVDDEPVMADITLTAQWECAGHVGGTATCTAPAICTTCQQPYGEKDPDNHTSTEFTYDDDRAYDAKHNVVHACCGAFVREEDCTGYFDCFGIEGSTQNRVMTMIFYCDKGHEVDRFESEDTSDHVDGTCQTPATETFNFKFDLSDKYENIWERFTLDTDSAEWLNYTWDAETATATYVWTSAKDPDNHAEAIRYENLGTEGHKAYYPCCQSADAAAAEAHDYTHDPDTHTCLCGDVEMFTVTWIADGETVETTTMEYGSYLMMEPEVPAKEGYTGSWDREVGLVTEDITVTAVYTPNTYMVDWYVNGSLHYSKGVKYGEVIEDLTYNAPEGHTFDGWEGYTEGMTMPAQNLTFHAILTPIQYSITWEMNGCDYEVYYPSELPTKLAYNVGGWDHQIDFAWIEAPAGYRFVKFVDGNGNELSMDDHTDLASVAYRLWVTVSGDMTIKAVIEPMTYTATWTDGNGASYEKEFKYGETITIPDNEFFNDTFRETGYTLTGWEGYTEDMTMPVDGITFTAIYTPNQYTITFDSDGGTEVKSMTQAYGSAITAPENPAKDGFHFVKWDALPETMPAENLTVKAVWEAHSGGTATCDKGQVCACGAEYTEKLGHDYRWTGNAEAHWQVCARDESHVTTACTKALSHSYRMGDGNVIEVTQVCDCGYSGEFAEVTLSGISFPYTGKAIEPHSIAYPDSWLGEKNIVPTYSGNVDATDSATMTLGRYSLTFAITKATPKAEDFVLTLPEDLTYDGQRKAVTVVPAAGVAGMGEITVICCLPGGDQEHAVEPVDVNAYIVSVNVAEGDNYEGVANLTLGRFEITPAKATYTAPAANAVTYTGNAQALVTPGTANGGKLVYSLTENGTYTETIPTGTDAGAYTVYYKVIGDANHTDTDVQSVVVNIAKADPVIGTVGCEMALFDSTAVSDVVLTRTNTAVEGTLVLTDAELTAGEGTYNWKFTPKDGDNYNTITGTVMLTVTADVLERIEASGTLDKRAYVYGDAFSIDGLTVTAVYTSNAAEDVTASVQYGKTLSVGQTSVELSYQGKTCTVGGITVAKKQLVIESMSWEVPENAVYSGNEYTATLKGTLPAGVQVTTSGDKAADAGSYTAKAVFSLAEGYSADNYEIVNGADLTKAWGIEEKDISDAEITLGAALTFNGEAQTQAVAGVKIGDLAVTYTVSGNTGTNADDYTLTVTGNGNFKGTATKAWNIAKKDISGATITLGDELTYNGEEQTQSVAKAEIDGLTVTCTVSGNEQTNAGNYTLTVTGNGNFEGEATAQWRIAKATYDMRGVKWNYTDAFRYDGKPHMVEVVGLPVGVTVSGYTGNNAAKVGEYTAAVTFSYDADNYEAPVLADLTWKIVNEWIPNEYTVTTPNSEGWLNEEFAVTAKEDYQISATNTADGIWQNALTFSADTGNGSVTFYLRNKTTGAISLEKTESYKIDKTPATGKITIGELTGWEAFVNSISFNLFFKDMQTVTITGADALSGVQSVEYYASATAMTLEEVKAVTNWSAYNGGVNVPVEDAKQFVYFAKITDKAGNVSYLSTDGAVYDTAAPVIGIEPGTYYTTQTVIVTEANPDTLTLNGKSVTSPITLDGNKDTTYTIVAKDKVGHQVTVTVTMKAIDSLDDTIADLNENNVTSADREDIQDVLDGVNELLEDENLSQAEKDSLTDIKTKAEDLLDAIDKAADAVDTEDIQKVKDTNSTNVRLDDKEDLEKAKEDLEDALKDENKGNYTEAEQKAIQKELDRINEALRIIEQTEAVLDAIDALPKSVEPDLDAKTERAIRNTKAAYDELNDYQKSLIDQVRKKKLEKLLDALDDYRIIKGSGKKWEKGSDKSLVFTANGPDRKFEELRIDGRAVGASNYTHKDGSTIITLKASYLQTLSIGKHTIQVVYTDGATDGKDFFRICNSGSNPATGDDMNMLLFGGTMMTSLFCLAVMAMFICRKKEKNER